MSAAQMDPHDQMRSRDISKVARGEQAPRPAHEYGTVSKPPPPQSSSGAAPPGQTNPTDVDQNRTGEDSHKVFFFLSPPTGKLLRRRRVSNVLNFSHIFINPLKRKVFLGRKMFLKSEITLKQNHSKALFFLVYLKLVILWFFCFVFLNFQEATPLRVRKHSEDGGKLLIIIINHKLSSYIM